MASGFQRWSICVCMEMNQAENQLLCVGSRALISVQITDIHGAYLLNPSNGNVHVTV